MKRIPYLFTILAVIACQQEIPVRFDEEGGKIVLQGELKTNETLHTLFLSIGSPNGLTDPGDDAKIRCFINGEQTAVSIQDGYDSFEKQVLQRHLIPATFHPGDQVRFEASVNGSTVIVETTVPSPPVIQVDSTSVRSLPDYTPHEMGQIEKIEARTYQFRLTLHDIPGQEDCYKTLTPQIYYTDNPVEGDAAPGPGDKIIPHLGSKLLKTDDPVYTNVSSPIPAEVEAYTGLSLGGTNAQLIFTDKLFRNDKKGFLLNPLDQLEYVDYENFFSSDKIYRCTIVFEAATICEEAFRYYNSVNNYLGAGPFNEPVPLQSNVVGGYGFVHIMAVAQQRIRLKDLHLGFFGYDWKDLYPMNPDSH